MESFSCSNFNYLPARQLFFDMQIRGENELFSPEALNNDLLLPCCEIEQFMWLHFFPKTGQIISSCMQVKPQDSLTIQFIDGYIDSNVEAIHPERNL